jgi:hypothetical protein
MLRRLRIISTLIMICITLEGVLTLSEIAINILDMSNA